MSRREREDPRELDDEEEDDEEDESLEELDEEVEYFVDAPEEVCCFTSVPKSVHSSQTSSSAPSTFTRLGELVSFPHISH
jgi:hypothetical protein